MIYSAQRIYEVAVCRLVWACMQKRIDPHGCACSTLHRQPFAPKCQHTSSWRNRDFAKVEMFPCCEAYQPLVAPSNSHSAWSSSAVSFCFPFSLMASLYKSATPKGAPYPPSREPRNTQWIPGQPQPVAIFLFGFHIRRFLPRSPSSALQPFFGEGFPY